MVVLWYGLGEHARRYDHVAQHSARPAVTYALTAAGMAARVANSASETSPSTPLTSSTLVGIATQGISRVQAHRARAGMGGWHCVSLAVSERPDNYDLMVLSAPDGTGPGEPGSGGCRQAFTGVVVLDLPIAELDLHASLATLRWSRL